MAVRDQVNGEFQNSCTMSANSLPVVNSHNPLLSQPVSMILRIDVSILFYPFPRPVNYPSYFDIDMEIVRQEIVEDISV
jgi:hypothetical protein